MARHRDDPSSERRSDLRIGVARWIRTHHMCLGVLLLGWLHSLFYVVALPPWDLYDEEQHLSYALTLRDERRLPRLDETIQSEIVASAIETDRWSDFRLGRPVDVSSAATMGLEGRSYEAYQPPFYYGLLVIGILPAGDDALRALYVGRALGSLLFVAYVALTWVLAGSWFPGRRDIQAAAALVVAAIPAGAQASARVGNDLFAAVLVTGSLTVLTRVVDRPRQRDALALGLLAAAAVLTKSHALIILPVVVLGLLIVWWRTRAVATLAALSLGPSLLAAGLWSLWNHHAYGTLDGTTAYLDRYQTYQPLPWEKFLKTFWLNAWSDYWGAYGNAGNLLVVTNAVLIGVVLFGVARVNWSRRLPLRVSVPVSPALALALCFCMLLALVYANHTAIVRPGGRILLPVYPVLAVLTIRGWQQSRLVWLPPLVTIALSLTYIVFWFNPFF